MPPDHRTFDIVIVAQRGRLAAEAALFAVSLRAADPGFEGRLIVAEPQPGPAWPSDPRLDAETRAFLADHGADLRPFENRAFDHTYPNGNKAEALAALTDDRPAVFFDTDTLVMAPVSALPFDFARLTASMNREATWPVIEPYGPGYTATWRALYDRFGLDFEATLDREWPDEYWRRYLYFNAGWFTARHPATFGARLRDMMVAIRDDPPPELVCQPLYPWLDQIALPLAIAEAGGGRPPPALAALDGRTTLHYRAMPLFYARASEAQVTFLEKTAAPNRVKKVLKRHEPFRRMIYQGRGRKVRALFEGAPLPAKEKAIRNRIRKAGLWMR